jgi:hypothetical protein
VVSSLPRRKTSPWTEAVGEEEEEVEAVHSAPAYAPRGGEGRHTPVEEPEVVPVQRSDLQRQIPKLPNDAGTNDVVDLNSATDASE